MSINFEHPMFLHNSSDVSAQKLELFSYIEENHKSLSITWEKIAYVLKEFLDKGNLASNIRDRLKCKLVG